MSDPVIADQAGNLDPVQADAEMDKTEQLDRRPGGNERVGAACEQLQEIRGLGLAEHDREHGRCIDDERQRMGWPFWS